MRSEDHSNPLVFLFKEAWRYSVGNRGNMVGFYAMFTVATSLMLFLDPLIMAKMMNVVVEVIKKQELDSASLRTICILAVLPFGVQFVFWCFHGPARVMENINAFKARANYRKYLLNGVINLPMKWHAEHHSGDTIDKIEKGSSALFQFSRDSFEVVYSIIQFVGSFCVLAYFSPGSIPILLFFIVLSGVITIAFDKKLIPQYRELNHAENQVSEGVFDAISNISTVIILRVEKLVFKGIAKKIDYRFDVFKNNNALNELKWFATSMCTGAMTSAVFFLYFWSHRHNLAGISAGNVFILYSYLEQISNTLFRFTNMYSDIVVRATRMQNAAELSQEFQGADFATHVLPANWNNLEVRGLTFSYHSEEGDLHLEDVSLSINRGERIALVGGSGHGKSTLLQVMRDLYQPRTLSLTVDGRVVDEGFGGIAHGISLVPQCPEIFTTSIWENITLGAEHEEETVARFADMACFTEVVERLPQGFQSSIKEKGVNLSGGEQQRLALTRGLLASADKDIVLLDEPTASIDAANEMEIYKRIFTEFPDKTIISTIHRLHLLPEFDKIYMFERGRVVAEGTLGELLLTNEAFQELWARYTVEKQEV